MTIESLKNLKTRPLVVGQKNPPKHPQTTHTHTPPVLTTIKNHPKPKPETTSWPPPNTPIFVYGSLQSPSMLSWVLTGVRTDSALFANVYTAATLPSHRRYPVLGADYPAVVADESGKHQVQGRLYYPRSEDEWSKLDVFEGSLYQRTQVVVQTEGGEVAAEMYLWDGGREVLDLEGCWDLGFFERERVGDWLDLFEGGEGV